MLIFIVFGLVVVMGGSASGQSNNSNEIIVGWETPEGLIPPQCFVKMWMSNDNFDAFSKTYGIKNSADFDENPGKYIGGKIPIETTLTPWGNDGDKIFLAAPYNLCFKGSLNDGIVENQKTPHVTNIDGNSIKSEGKYRGSEYAYNILAKVPLTICQDLAPNLKGECKQSFLIALGDYGGGSMGWVYEYNIYGLFAFKDNRRFIVPLKRFEKQNDATNFLKTPPVISAKLEEERIVAKRTLMAEQGEAQAQKDLGIMYYNGRGVSQDYKEAFKWYTKAAKQGNANAFSNLGALYANGQGTKVNFKEAIKWFKLAVENGDAQAQKNLEIVEKLEKQRIEEERIAAKGDADELFELGWKYRNENEGKAIKWYKLSAKKGNYDAQVNLTNIANVAYDDEDYKTALGIYEVLAGAGVKDSQFRLGLMYHLGKGTEVSKKDAVIWYEKASEQGEGSASHNLGVIYENDNNLVEAERWYQIAVKQGEDSKAGLENIKKLRTAEKEKAKKEAAKKAAKKAEKAAKKAEKEKFKLIMRKAEKYRDVVRENCEKEEEVSQCITGASCIVASIIEELKHDDRGKKFKKTIEGGLLSKGSFDKAFDELKKSADKALENRIMGLTLQCLFQ